MKTSILTGMFLKKSVLLFGRGSHNMFSRQGCPSYNMLAVQCEGVVPFAMREVTYLSQL